MPDMIAARQELDLRPQLERLDGLICWSEGIDAGALGFAFRPLWQLDEPARAALALTRAQATAVYAGLKLWPDAVLARLAEAQLVADGTYPNAAAVFGEGAGSAEPSVSDAFPVRSGFDPDELRGPDGRWIGEGGSSPASPIVPAHQVNEDPDPTPEEEEDELGERLRHQNDLLKQFRFGPDPNGIIRIPTMPGSVKPTTVPPTTRAPAEVVTPPAKPQAPETAGSAPRSTIRFGVDPNQIFHTYRHTDEAGIDRARVELAVRNDLMSKLERLQDGLNKGSVVVDGQKLDYNAFKLPSGEVNVGRITISR